VSASGFTSGGPAGRQRADEQLTATITAIHQASRGSYGSPRVPAELRLGQDVRCGRKRVERLMRSAGIACFNDADEPHTFDESSGAAGDRTQDRRIMRTADWFHTSSTRGAVAAIAAALPLFAGFS
jgi:hypothetical protein